MVASESELYGITTVLSPLPLQTLPLPAVPLNPQHVSHVGVGNPKLFHLLSLQIKGSNNTALCSRLKFAAQCTNCCDLLP